MAKKPKNPNEAKPTTRRSIIGNAARERRRAEPLEVRLTLRYRFGDEPDDTVTVMDDRAVPMVDSVFKNRDRIVRALAMTLVRAGITRPKVVTELVPGLDLLRRAVGKGKTGRKPRG